MCDTEKVGFLIGKKTTMLRHQTPNIVAYINRFNLLVNELVRSNYYLSVL